MSRWATLQAVRRSLATLIAIPLFSAALLADDSIRSAVATIDGNTSKQIVAASKKRDSSEVRKATSEQYRQLREVTNEYPKPTWKTLSDQDVSALSDLYVRTRQYDLALDLSASENHRSTASPTLQRTVVRVNLFRGNYNEAAHTLSESGLSAPGAPLGDLNYPIAHGYAARKDWIKAMKFSERSLEDLFWNIDNRPKNVGPIRLRVKLHGLILAATLGAGASEELRNIRLSLMERSGQRASTPNDVEVRLSKLLYSEVLMSMTLDINDQKQSKSQILEDWASQIVQFPNDAPSDILLPAAARLIAFLELELHTMRSENIEINSSIQRLVERLDSQKTSSDVSTRVKMSLISRSEALVHH